ncbi:ead/Ea22-like family protein [Rhodoferax mekongensis]|uniref:Ead/Ea22-like family protein n=1 Tax=Rhodoferax mekongensis TaxID=3068341 RepID=A0ABZ0B2I5_9BURK|nr:ead/Ea22-like family protein [Rhodoferax sp. TBRC 17307]WNO05997.1 ead/Ea22-like family protein [Rhodoferax sp. TBRC 17307]
MADQELRRLAEDATQGEWHWDCDEVKGDPFGRVRYQVITSGKTITKIYYSSYEGGPTNAKDDAAYIAAANPAAILELLDRLEKAEKDAERLVWAMHNMSNPFGRHEFGFSQHVLEQGSTGDINDCRTYIDAQMEASK